MSFNINAKNVRIEAGNKFELPIPITAIGMTLEVFCLWQHPSFVRGQFESFDVQWDWEICGGDPFLDVGFQVVLRR